MPGLTLQTSGGRTNRSAATSITADAQYTINLFEMVNSSLFSSFMYNYRYKTFFIKIDIGWLRTRVLWCWKWLLCQLCATTTIKEIFTSIRWFTDVGFQRRFKPTTSEAKRRNIAFFVNSQFSVSTIFARFVRFETKFFHFDLWQRQRLFCSNVRQLLSL